MGLLSTRTKHPTIDLVVDPFAPALINAIVGQLDHGIPILALVVVVVAKIPRDNLGGGVLRARLKERGEVRNAGLGDPHRLVGSQVADGISVATLCLPVLRALTLAVPVVS